MENNYTQVTSTIEPKPSTPSLLKTLKGNWASLNPKKRIFISVVLLLIILSTIFLLSYLGFKKFKNSSTQIPVYSLQQNNNPKIVNYSNILTYTPMSITPGYEIQNMQDGDIDNLFVINKGFYVAQNGDVANSKRVITGNPIKAFVISPDKNYIAYKTSVPTGHVYIYDVKNNKNTTIFTDYFPSKFSFSPSSKYLFVSKGNTGVYDIQNGKLLEFKELYGYDPVSSTELPSIWNESLDKLIFAGPELQVISLSNDSYENTKFDLTELIENPAKNVIQLLKFDKDYVYFEVKFFNPDYTFSADVYRLDISNGSLIEIEAPDLKNKHVSFTDSSQFGELYSLNKEEGIIEIYKIEDKSINLSKQIILPDYLKDISQIDILRASTYNNIHNLINNNYIILTSTLECERQDFENKIAYEGIMLLDLNTNNAINLSEVFGTKKLACNQALSLVAEENSFYINNNKLFISLYNSTTGKMNSGIIELE